MAAGISCYYIILSKNSDEFKSSNFLSANLPFNTFPDMDIVEKLRLICNVFVLNCDGFCLIPPNILSKGNILLDHLNRKANIGITAVIAAPIQ